EGESAQLHALGLDAAGTPMEGLVFDWASSDEAVATVDADGKVTALLAGSAEIRATAREKVGLALVTVRLVCADGRADCNGDPSDRCETDLRGDARHCGGCGIACEEDEVCSLGACAKECASGLTACGDACVDTTTNPAHCGGCDAACDGGWTCEEGSCV